MINDGIIKYEGYNTKYGRGKGLKNNRKKKRAIIRKKELQDKREREKLKKILAFAKKRSEYENNFYRNDENDE